MQSSPSSNNSLQNGMYYGDDEAFDPLSANQTNLSSINKFLNSYQILKKYELPIYETKLFFQKQQQHNKKSGNHTHTNNLSNSLRGGSLLNKDSSSHHLKKKEDRILELTKTVSKQKLNSHIHQVTHVSFMPPSPKLPADNQFIVLNSGIKCSNLLTRIRTLDNEDDLNKRPMFSYQQWKQVSSQVKRIFNKVLQTSMKQLNTGTLIAIKPNQSLSIRTDYYCFHPHQVYTTLLALDKSDINSGTLAFCSLTKQFVDKEFPKHNDQFQLLDKVNKERREIEWQYLEIKEGNLILLGKDVIYGSFRNDSQTAKFFAQMRWVRHQSASNSSNSS